MDSELIEMRLDVQQRAHDALAVIGFSEGLH